MADCGPIATDFAPLYYWQAAQSLHKEQILGLSRSVVYSLHAPNKLEILQ